MKFIQSIKLMCNVAEWWLMAFVGLIASKQHQQLLLQQCRLYIPGGLSVLMLSELDRPSRRGGFFLPFFLSSFSSCIYAYTKLSAAPKDETRKKKKKERGCCSETRCCWLLLLLKETEKICLIKKKKILI